VQGAGGIEDMSFLYELGDKTSAQVDGKALPGQEDYLLRARVTKEEVGSVEAGYRSFRTFYDGAGGFFPLNNAWLPLYPRELHVDRGEFFINATVALPNKPVFTFHYSNATRDGRKDSTIWGDTDQTGIPIYSSSSLNPISANRKIVPAYLNLDERQENWEAAVRHTFGRTTGVLSISGTNIDNLDTRSIDRYPGEVKPFPAIPSNPPVLVSPLQANNQNKGTDQQHFKEDSLMLGARFETVLSPRYTLFGGLNYRRSDNDITASRLVTASLATAIGVVAPVGAFTSGGRPPYSYNSSGNLEYDVWTGNIGLKSQPFRDLRLDVALKGEEFKVNGHNNVVYVNNLVNLNTGAITQQLVSAPVSSDITDKPWTPQIDLRYTGIKHVAFFALWDQRSGESDEIKNSSSISTSGSTINPSFSTSTEKVNETHSNLKVGLNWSVSRSLELRGEFFTKDHENTFQGYGISAADYYIFNYDTSGYRLSAVLRPHPTVSFNTRYLYLKGEGDVAATGYAQGDSNDTNRYEIGETIDWTPKKEIYLQLNVNVVFDSTSTAYPRAGGSANDVLHNADNNFWNGSFLTGFVLTKHTDAQFQATYYEADNYNPALAATTTPYGQSVRD